MLTRHDDMLCHQLARPFESVPQSDPNRNVMDGFAGIAIVECIPFDPYRPFGLGV